MRWPRKIGQSARACRRSSELNGGCCGRDEGGNGPWKPQDGVQRRANPTPAQGNQAGQSDFAVIVETRIRNNGNCRLRKVPWQERVRPGAGQFYAIPDETTQPEEPGGIHEYRPGKYSDSCSRYGLNPSPLLNHPSCRSCCVREPDQPTPVGLKMYANPAGAKGVPAKTGPAHAFQKVRNDNQTTACRSRKKPAAESHQGLGRHRDR